MITKSSPGVFKWGHVFQRGDLPIYITDASGNPVDPYSIKFTLFYQPRSHYSGQSGSHPQIWACHSGCRNPSHPHHPVIAGVCHRTPVQAAPGEYYATGCAGQCGQPGQWYVNWVIQEYFQGTFMEDRSGFEVFDTAQYFPPGVGMMGRPSGCHTPGVSPSCRWCCKPNPCGCANSRGW